MKSFVFLVGAGALFCACTITHLNPSFPGSEYCGTVDACEHACSNGDAHACGYMSQAALVGSGVPRSADKFISYATKGCEGNDGRSCAMLAVGYFQSVGLPKDWSKAAEYNDKACLYGYSVGCNSLGLAYRDGHGVEQDPARAAALFAQACDGGSALGCLSLAQGSLDGMVPDDRAAKALPLLVHDCDPQVNPAIRVCTVAAKMYANGRGAPQDVSRAKSLYDAACKRGDPDACDQLQRL
jgi:TPR repeat protein